MSETMSETQGFKLFNEETKRLNVYHLEDMAPYFADRMDKPSGRIFKVGKKAIEGLKMIERDYNRSWYSCLRGRWEKANKMGNEMLFYRGNIYTAGQTFEMADKLAGALVSIGIEKGDEIACPVTNHPIVPLIMLAGSKIGIKLNFFGSHYDPAFIDVILGEVSHKLIIATDDQYPEIAEAVEKVGFDHKLLVSLADCLPEDPSKTEGYEPELADYYKFENIAKQYAEKDNTVYLFDQVLAMGVDHVDEVVDDNGLDTDFLITYTSGSTRIGFPKRMIHRNRSPITVGVFHDPELCGNPLVKRMRGMALLHTDTNTDLITMYSDAFFQLWSVSMEPSFTKEKFLDELFINKPTFVLATTCSWLHAANENLIEGRYADRKMKWLLVTMAVGEPLQPGEEEFINTWLKKNKAGVAVPLIGPIRLPWAPIGIGGGDTEHGGIYYTLFKDLPGGKNKGMAPVPYAQAAILKKVDGVYKECGYNEYGLIVANSATNMAGYKNPERTLEKIVTDEYGMQWITCGSYGCIDNKGAIHMKDRDDCEVTLENGKKILPFMMVDSIQRDSKNIMSSVVTTPEANGKTWLVVNFQYSPLSKKDHKKIIADMQARLTADFPEVIDHVLYREFTAENPMPVAASTKRNVKAMIDMGIEGILEA